MHQLETSDVIITSSIALCESIILSHIIVSMPMGYTSYHILSNV